jgi:hypothetical protein
MHNLSNQVWVKSVYDGQPTSDNDSTGAFATLDINYTCPRVLFLMHGIDLEYDSVAGATSTATMQWKLYYQSTYIHASDADWSDYTNLSSATMGPIAITSSTGTPAGPYMMDVNAIKLLGGQGSLMVSFYSSDATKMAVHCVALGYGGLTNKQPSTTVVSV